MAEAVDKYNKLTLTPKDEQEQRLFFEWRSKDIVEMYKVGVIFLTIEMVIWGAIALYSNGGKNEWSIFISTVMFWLARLLIMTIGKRFRDKMSYLIVGDLIF